MGDRVALRLYRVVVRAPVAGEAVAAFWCKEGM